MFKWFSLGHKRKKLRKHERVCYDYDYYFVEMPNEDNKILKNNQGKKSSKAPAIFYADRVFTWKTTLKKT